MYKNNYFKSLTIVAAMIFAAFTGHAQQMETSVYINGIFPVAQFNNAVELMPTGEFVPMDRSNVATGATAGLAATARFGMWFNVGFGQLMPWGEVSFMWNSTKGSLRDIYDQNEYNVTVQSVPTTPTYFNIPIILGLKYRYDVTPIIRPFAELGIGYDALFITSNGYHNSPEIGNQKWYSYNPSGNLCWSVGAGTYLGEYVSVGLYYMGLGNHRIEYRKGVEASNPEAPDYFIAQKRRLGELGIRVGFHF